MKETFEPRCSGEGGNRPPMDPERINRARASVCPLIVYTFMGVILTENVALDRELTQFFRENPRFGSHDRRLISETLFALCRWWGWVRRFVPNDDIQAWSNLSRQQITQQPRWTLPLLLACALEEQSIESGVQRIWADENRLNPQKLNWYKFSLEEKARAFADVMRVNPPHPMALFPVWFKDECGAAGADFFAQNIELLQKRPPLWLRIQHEPVREVLAALNKDGLSPLPHPALQGALRISQPRINMYETAAYKKGWVEIQDISSQCIGWICAPKKGSRWLDYCAGAGGKTLHLGALMQGKGTVVAVDKRNWKLKDLHRRAVRADLHNIMIKESTGEFPKVNAASFDGVLVDAPCSCTGTWRRNPDARWTTAQSEIDELAQLQFEILSHACKAVKPGGVLVYATCSFAEKENEALVRRFLAEHPEFRADEFPHPLFPDRTCSGTVRFAPADADGDALFAARLIRS